MKVKNQSFKSIKELEDKLDISSIDPSKTLIQVFSGYVEEDEIKKIQAILKAKNTDAKFIGTTTAGEIFDAKVKRKSITLSIVEFDETLVEYGFFDDEDDFNLGVKVAKNMFQDNSKAAILFISGLLTNGEDVVDGISSINSSIVLAGGLAGDNGNIEKTLVFDDEHIKENACVIAVLNSKVLNVINDYQLNWQPFGKVMKVTKVEKNRLYEVDGVVIADLYRKYLGDNVANRFPISAIEFPLIKTNDEVEICRAFSHVFDDGSVLTIGNLQVGDDVRFAVGNVDLIVNQTKEFMDNYFQVQPEVIFNYSCAGRISFLQSNVEIELKPFNDIAPTVGFFSYGEIMNKNNKNFLLNYSLTFLGLSETIKEIQKKKDSVDAKTFNLFEDKHFIVIDALTHLSNTVIKELDNSKAETEEAHRRIKDSIEFASLIQKAILPKSDVFLKYTKEHFTIWEPKDIVGGDMYFTIDLDNSDEFIVMVIDGAGHGVSGAFVTMLVKAIESKITVELKSKTLSPSPAKILEYFNKDIKTMLNQQKRGSKSNAGFDGGILYYNKTTKKCKFAGAKTDLYIVQGDTISKVKGDRKNVGFVRTKINQTYTDHEISLTENTSLYISTDGLFDQEGEKDSRFGSKRFEKLLLQMQDMSLKNQAKNIKESFKAFKGDIEQIDDVTVVGLKF